MRKILTIGGALLTLAALASTADARMMGGGMSMSSSMSRTQANPTFTSPGAPHGSDVGLPRPGGGTSMPSSMPRAEANPAFTSPGSPRGSDVGLPQPGGGSSDSRLQTRVKGSNWKHPIDSDNGGPADPPNKPPKGSTQGSSGNNGVNPWDPYGFHNHHPGTHGYVDKYGHYHPPTGGGSSADNTEPAPASRTPR